MSTSDDEDKDLAVEDDEGEESGEEEQEEAQPPSPEAVKSGNVDHLFKKRAAR